MKNTPASLKGRDINLKIGGIINTDSNLAIQLPLNLKSIFIGTMLGDGSLYRSSPTSNVRFEMSFGQKYELFALHLG